MLLHSETEDINFAMNSEGIISDIVQLRNLTMSFKNSHYKFYSKFSTFKIQ